MRSIFKVYIYEMHNKHIEVKKRQPVIFYFYDINFDYVVFKNDL